MNYRRTKSGLNLSELGLGCMNLPQNLSEAAPIMDLAVEHGINYFDTADLYNKGGNETLIGNYLKERHRDKVLIGSKVGNAFNMKNDDVTWDASKKHIMDGIKSSLKRLQLDYLDLYMLHGGMIEDNKEETIEAFNILKKDGLIRAYGISSIRPNVIRYYLDHSDIDIIMMQYNLIDNRPEMLIDEIHARDIKILARGPVMQGILTSNYKEVLNRKFDEGKMGYTKEQLIDIVSQLEHPAASSYRYLLDQPVASIITGASSKTQLEANIAQYQLLSKQHIEPGRDLFQNLNYEDHLQ